MSNALAVRCRNPGEFIASVVERHRGFPLPRSEDEKTYLVFIGEGEEGVLELIPGPDREFVESSVWRGDPGEAGEYEGDEGEGYPEVDREEDDETPLHQARIRRAPRRIQIRYIPHDEIADSLYREEGRNFDYNFEENESEANEGSALVQRGRLGFGESARAADEKGLNEVMGEELVEQLSRIPSKLSGRSDVTSDGEDERNFPVNGIDETRPDKLNQQFSQSRPLQEESDDRSDEILGEVEERYHSAVSNSRWDPDEAHHEQNIKPDKLIDGREGARFPMANKEFPQSPQLLAPALQEEPGLPVPNEITSKNLSPSSRPLEFEAIREFTEENDGNIKKKASNKATGDRGKESRRATPEERRSTELYGTEGREELRSAVNEVPPRRRSMLQVLEPGSPIHPQPDKISSLTTSSHSSVNLNKNRGGPIKPEEDDLAEADEDEALPYPATTLENLIATEHINIIYLEDLEALHGFLEAMLFSPAVSAPNPPLLAIWGLVGAHYQTEYFGGEGIGDTVARAVETAAKSGRLLVLGEGYIEVDYGDGENEVQEQCWMDVEVPILNTGSMVVGRTVGVGQILRRWCRFGEDLEDLEEGEGEGEGCDDAEAEGGRRRW